MPLHVPKPSYESGIESFSCQSADNEDPTGGDGSRDVGILRRSRRQQEFEALHQEMELVEHGVAKSGHARRVVPRRQSKVRTMKRKLLERQEAASERGNNDEDNVNDTITIRPRGARAAIDDVVIQQSLIFGSAKHLSSSSRQNGVSREQEVDHSDEDSTVLRVQASTGAELDEESDGDEGLNVDDDEHSDESTDEDTPDADVGMEAAPSTRSARNRSTTTKVTTKRPKSSNPVRKARRPLQKRLRNFRSRKMAERHGAALGAHVSGKPGLAIRKLKQVAASAPAAPQVYSSLGMVYEDMLVESQRKYCIGRYALKKGTPSVDSETQDDIICEQLSLAKKAYGSYHVAAIFCKRDYSLWLRAADSAFEIAGLHTTTMTLPGMAKEAVEYHRSEKLRWLEEARHDYHMADNLNPPGIEIPAKLASTMIELGHLSEALTLLTDLKNKEEFHSSFRAWILFADLMLRIGHECIQWNQGVQTNGNHMFRRWLRKLSIKFDWQERRLQALAKALEAACGSRSCQRFIQWLEQRIETSDAFDVIDDTNDPADEESAREASTQAVEGQLLLSTTNGMDALEKERQFLLQTNLVELTTFDEVTETLNIHVGSSDAAQRDAIRLALIAKHKSSLVQLVGDFYTKQGSMITTITADSLNDGKLEGGKSDRFLPLSASCNTAFSIASELLRHLLGMQLFEGGALAGESVSLYVKERVASRDRRLQAKNEFDQSQKRSVDVFAMHRETYDEADYVSDEGKSLLAPLSDDEDFDNADNYNGMRAMRSGILPPEIQFLYGLCLAGEGGKLYSAVACIQAIKGIPLDPVSWIEESIVDTGVFADTRWLHFRLERTDGLGRVAALSLAVDVFASIKPDRRLTVQISSLFRQSVEELAKRNMLDKVFFLNGQVNSVSTYRRNLLLRILVAETRFGVDTTESQDTTSAQKQSILINAIDFLSKVLPVVWMVDKGSINSTCCETITIIALTLRLISLRNEDSVMESGFLVSNLFRIISTLCNSTSLSISDDIPRSREISLIPFSSSWLSPDLMSLSLRSFNLCVAINVSLFSGWESEQFSLRLLRGTTFNYFGITTEDGLVAGYVTKTHEEELGCLWKLVRSILPALEFDFNEKLQVLKESVWYKTSRERYTAMESRHKICAYEEDSALSSLLSFARMCLQGEMKAQVVDSKLVFLALSIMVPVSQFCLHGTAIWDAHIGRQESGGSTKLWQDFSCLEKASSAPSCRPGYIRPCKRSMVAVVENDSERALHEWFSWEDSSDPLSNLVAIPLRYFQQTWCQSKIDDTVYEMQSSTEFDLMKEVDECIAKLRLSCTIPAAEKAALQVSVSLLHLASQPKCRNPFVCLQQAAMFASMSSKGGTCDHVFQDRLPQPEVCRPIDALLIVGRAECLNALHFCQEAAFLCCYVAATCALHRKEDPLFHKDERWKIITSLAYDLSVVIRNLAGALLREHDKREDTTGTWDVVAVLELRQARTTALEWKEKAEIRALGIIDLPISVAAMENRRNHPPSPGLHEVTDSPLIEPLCAEGLNTAGSVAV